MKSNSTSHFAQGVRLFNQRKFFEAHEVWEEIWKSAMPEEKIFYQGLIQAAAALVHVQRGNYRGAVALFSKSCRKLDRLPALWRGIDVEQLRADLVRYFANISSGADEHGEDSRLGCEQAADLRCLPGIKWTDEH